MLLTRLFDVLSKLVAKSFNLFQEHHVFCKKPFLIALKVSRKLCVSESQVTCRNCDVAHCRDCFHNVMGFVEEDNLV
jgi:hypothetical protein